MTDQLASAVSQEAAGYAYADSAVVDSRSPLTVNYRGGSVTASSISGYSPQVGDTVSIIVQGSSYLVVGKLVPSADTRAWTAVTPQSGWSNFGGIYPPLSCRLAPYSNDMLQVRGVIQTGVSSTGTIIGFIPAAMAPVTYAQRSTVYAFGASLNIVTETPAVDVATSGNMTIVYATNATILALNFQVPRVG